MAESTPIRIGIAGTGVMGGHHTRVAASLPHCRLTGIYDVDSDRARQVAEQFGATVFASLEDLCAAADGIIIATPTNTHAEVASICLRAGRHVLLEKPIAATIAEAEALVALANTRDRMLMIGHIERYNPAVSTTLSLLDHQELFACELQRLSISQGRDCSADIIFDLMIHDIDLALAFAQAPVIAVSAMGHRLRGELIDHVTALLRFENGIIATLTASWLSQERVRRARLFTRSAQFAVDFASREVNIHRQGQSSIAANNGLYHMASLVEQLLVPNKEPLAIEQEHFLACIRTHTQPITDGEAGLQALRLAYTIQERVNEQLSTLKP